MKKVIITSLIASTILLSGCGAIKEKAAGMVLGDKFVQANAKLNQCDLSSLTYLKNAAADDKNPIVQNAALLVLGAHFAADGNMHAVDTVAQKIANMSDTTTFAEQRKTIIEGGKETAKDRINNGFTANCK
ncbi:MULTISPECIES: hypothetical protein [unclassified Photobacterium]|uniref:hypothetical protein n=1 Tax=unclassified Photobacterium TaxID=2628852 RepID=UPI001EDF0C8C|nr:MULTISPECIES: hypothetical protein [unclassified Photobacterium]MCG3865323.1 hypothetical protein [Photobacterium sp. Ph6]MCG3876855.1 hypothetical protein [Photobacterium sp. Ph5]